MLFGSISFAFIDVLIRFKEDNIIQLLYSEKNWTISNNDCFNYSIKILPLKRTIITYCFDIIQLLFKKVKFKEKCD